MSASVETNTPSMDNINTGWKRFGLGIILSVLSGIFLLLSFPPYGIWPLVWIALIPARIAQHRLFPLKWSSLGESITILVWLGPFLGRLFGTEFGPFFTYLGVLIAILVFFIASERKFHEKTGYRWYVLNGMTGWVGFEMIRATFIPLVATSGFIGYTLASQAWLIQPVSIFSVYGLNLLIIMVNYSLSAAVIGWLDSRWLFSGTVPMEKSTTRKWLVISGSVLAAWIIISLVILSGGKGDPKLKVAALQPNYSKPAFQDKSTTDISRVEDLTKWASEAAGIGAQIVFTPEMMFNFDPQENHKSELQALAKEKSIYLFLDYTFAVEGQPWRNEAVLLGSEGNFYSPAYAKNHAPPGEPLSPTAGGYPVYDTPLGRLAAMICHDANYTDVARKLTANGAQLISAGLNEFGGFGEQFWTNATFRAVENQVAVVVTSRQTGSSIIDAHGRQKALDLTPNKQVVLSGEMNIGSGPTIYTRMGDILGWISLAGMVFFIVFQTIIQGKAKKERKLLV